MGLLEDRSPSGLLGRKLSELNERPATANLGMLAQGLRARNKPEFQMKTNTLQGLLDGAALATSPVPILGDLVGLGADGNRFYNEPESRTPLNFGLAALGLLPFVPPMVSAGLGKFAQSQGKQLAAPPAGPGRNQAGAIVYHGSPHKFDAFDSSKIGTGEGAQAYGHGLYFAENPGVATEYRKKLANNPVVDGKDPFTDMGWMNNTTKGMANHALLTAKQSGKSGDEAILLAMENLRPPPGADSLTRQAHNDASNALGSLIGKDVAINKGALYKVDLPDEAIAKMLDWDKPLSQQAPEVRAALTKLGITVDDRDLGSFDDALLSALSGGPTALPKQPLNPAGSQVYEKLAAQPHLLPGFRVGQNSRDIASKYLKDSGIPGIRYLDGGSRGAGNGTSNFVVFPGNEGLLKILERQ